MPLRRWLKMGLMQKITVKGESKLIIQLRRMPTCCQAFLPQHLNPEWSDAALVFYLAGTQVTTELLVTTAASDSLDVVVAVPVKFL